MISSKCILVIVGACCIYQTQAESRYQLAKWPSASIDCNICFSQKHRFVGILNLFLLSQKYNRLHIFRISCLFLVFFNFKTNFLCLFSFYIVHKSSAGCAASFVIVVDFTIDLIIPIILYIYTTLISSIVCSGISMCSCLDSNLYCLQFFSNL